MTNWGRRKDNKQAYPKIGPKGVSGKGQNTSPVGDVHLKESLQEKYDTDLSKAEIKAIMKELDGEEIESISETDNGYEIETDGGSYLYFKDFDAAEREAIERVESDLENEPSLFSPDFIQSHLTMSDTDRSMSADDLAESHFDGYTSNRILDLAEEEGEISADEREEIENSDDMENKVEELGEKLKEKKRDEIYEELEDPVQYFVEDQGLYSLEDLLKQSFVRIDIEEAAKDAVDTDGVAHFLASYDGNERYLDNKGYLYRTN